MSHSKKWLFVIANKVKQSKQSEWDCFVPRNDVFFLYFRCGLNTKI